MMDNDSSCDTCQHESVDNGGTVESQSGVESIEGRVSKVEADVALLKVDVTGVRVVLENHAQKSHERTGQLLDRIADLSKDSMETKSRLFQMVDTLISKEDKRIQDAANRSNAMLETMKPILIPIATAVAGGIASYFAMKGGK